MVHHVVVLCLLIFLFFVIVGLIISLFYEDARTLIFSKEYIVNLVALFAVLSMVLLFRKLNVFAKTEFVFSVGILFGVLITVLLYRKRKSKEEEERP
jgi:Ca2+/Na+ antiporter